MNKSMYLHAVMIRLQTRRQKLPSFRLILYLVLLAVLLVLLFLGNEIFESLGLFFGS